MASVKQLLDFHSRLLTDYLQGIARTYHETPSVNLGYQVLTDHQHGQYQFIRLGWHDRKFHFLVLLHFDIKPDGKIWIQHNHTEIFIGEALASLGVEKEHIVISFCPEYLRSGTGYAVA